MAGRERRGFARDAAVRARIKPFAPVGTVRTWAGVVVNNLMTAPVRTGVVLDNLLLYVTGGAAVVHTKTTYTTNFGFGAIEELSRSAWNWGWVAGFGAEWRWSDRVGLRVETLYIETIDRNYSFFVPAFGGFNVNMTDSNQIWVSRVALHYKF